MQTALQVASIAVRSVEEASRQFTETLGLERVGPVHESQLGFDLRWQRIGSGGRGFIDLIEATDEESMVAKFLARRGEGVYLIQLGVPDLKAAAAELKERGARVIGAEHPDEMTMFWIHPSSAHGALIEVVEFDSTDGE